MAKKSDGSVHLDGLTFPDEARRAAGFQLGKVQAGLAPDDWKPFADAVKGTLEIRIRDATGIFRVMCAAKFMGELVSWIGSRTAGEEAEILHVTRSRVSCLVNKKPASLRSMH